MNIDLDKQVTEFYRSSSQKVRVITEDWVNKEAFCPACGYDIKQYENNRPVADFFCLNCNEEYELKSKKDSIGNKIVDGAYRTMIERLQSNNNPNLFLLNYNLQSFEVLNFLVIPKHFFVSQIIEKENPCLYQQGGQVGSVAIFLYKIFRKQGKYFTSKINKLNLKTKSSKFGRKPYF